MTYQPKCIYCHDRPASWGTYCDECGFLIRPHQWVATLMERQMHVASAERIIRDHQRRNQV